MILQILLLVMGLTLLSEKNWIEISVWWILTKMPNLILRLYMTYTFQFKSPNLSLSPSN